MERRLARLLKRDAEEIDSVPFSGDIGIQGNVPFRGAIFRRCPRVEHLQQITTANRAGDDTRNVALAENRGPVSLLRAIPVPKGCRLRESRASVSGGPHWLS